MGKTVRKIRPTDYWRIGEHESWFSDMSAEGLHLVKMGSHFAHFKKGEPRNIAYRIEATPKKGLTDEQIDLYEESGWEYITSYQYFHVFAAPADHGVTELHTDPAEQSYTLQHLSKRLIWNVIGVSICFLLIVGMLSALWFLDGTPVLQMVRGYVVQQTIVTLIILYGFYYTFRGMLAIVALKRDLKEGKPIDHSKPWKKSLRRNQVFSVAFILIALGSAIIPFVALMKMDTFTLPEGESSLPFVRLADIEQNPQLERGESYMSRGVDWANNYSINWSVFAPVQYEMDEVGVVGGMMWADGSGKYEPSLTAEIYKLTFKSLAEPLISDLIEWYSYRPEHADLTEIRHPAFDQLLVREDQEMKEIFVSKDKVVMYMRYHGYTEMDKLIEQVEKKIGLF